MWLLVSLLLIITSLLWYLTDPFYWKRRHIPYITPLPLFGNFISLFPYGMTEYTKKLNKTYSEYKYFGMHFFTRPILYIKDAELTQRILVTDFEYFTSHGFYSNQNYDPAAGSLAFVHGQQWKEIKGKLSRNFTPAKIKSMLFQIEETFPKLKASIDKKIQHEEQVDFSSLFLNYITDIITKTIFGVRSDVFEDLDSMINEMNELVKADQLATNMYIGFISPRLYDFLKLTVFGTKLNAFILDMVRKTIEYRRKENIYLKDFLQAMMELIEADCKEEVKYFPDKTRVPRYDLNAVIGQGLLLYTAGRDTMAFALIFLFYELARNPEVQDRCRAEITSVVKEGSLITGEDLSKLVYLQAAIQESMRIHSPLVMLNRECTKEYTIPNSDITIEPGTLLFIPSIYAHMEEKNYPKPEIFRPERFLGEEYNSIKPGAYFPFGHGPRTCIGMNYSLNALKLISSRLLQSFECNIGSKTQVPVRYAKYEFFTMPSENIWLHVNPVIDK